MLFGDIVMIFKIRSHGNIGNRIIQYISANEISKHWPESTIFNVKLDEYGLTTPDIDESPYRTLHINDFFSSEEEAIARIEQYKPDLVVFDGYLQKHFLMKNADHYRRLFPIIYPVDVDKDDLVINIRCGELIFGFSQYPLLPISYYKKIIEETNLNPVFMGQVDDSLYCRMLRQAFPEARFLDHVSPQRDFDLIRSAHNIVMGISTFSFISSWLSEAANIYTQLWGFFSVPSFLGEIDLLPTQDARYKYHVLPYSYALVEGRQIAFNQGIDAYIHAISADEVDAIKRRFSEKPPIQKIFQIDDFWYLNMNPDCGYQIANGLCFDPHHHYMTIGLWEGRSPAPYKKGRYRNVSHDKKAIISSYTEYAAGNSAEEQALNAINASKTDLMAFHTADEQNPFLIIDLLSLHKIDHVSIFNRCDNEIVAKRCLPLRVYCSTDSTDWSLLHVQQRQFGGSDGKPLEIDLYPDVTCRFIKITTLKKTILHLEKVHVYGEPLDLPI